MKRKPIQNLLALVFKLQPWSPFVYQSDFVSNKTYYLMKILVYNGHKCAAQSDIKLNSKVKIDDYVVPIIQAVALKLQFLISPRQIETLI